MTLAQRRSDDFGGPQDLHDAWRVLAGGAPKCARVLVDIAENGRVEGARVAAAKTLLEFAGFRAPTAVQVLPAEYDPAAPTAVAGDSPAARIRNRMAALAAATVVEDDDEITDAILVEDDGYDVVDAVVEPPE